MLQKFTPKFLTNKSLILPQTLFVIRRKCFPRTPTNRKINLLPSIFIYRLLKQGQNEQGKTSYVSISDNNEICAAVAELFKQKAKVSSLIITLGKGGREKFLGSVTDLGSKTSAIQCQCVNSSARTRLIRA